MPIDITQLVSYEKTRLATKTETTLLNEPPPPTMSLRDILCGKPATTAPTVHPSLVNTSPRPTSPAPVIVTWQPLATTGKMGKMGPIPLSNLPRTERWILDKKPPKDFPPITQGMEIIIKTKEDNTTTPQTPGRTRIGTIGRITFREKKWTHFVIEVSTASDSNIADDIKHTTLIIIAIPKEVMKLSWKERLHRLIYERKLDQRSEDPTWNKPLPTPPKEDVDDGLPMTKA
ncbi:hypothetical protein BKA70DRAFT_1418310 [Coprinopsis sp. MPI-PUGE-AT-0042]|nr:hypothetical protein BKA70DRAFT_1418310 [Coprinopsis sp. MPI-PUGE-AT-0042]